MMQIVLIRPGSTDYDQQGRIQGNLDIPLSDEGHREVVRTIDDLKSLSIESVYVAPCQSAKQTGKAIAESLGLKTKTLDKLQNVDHGLWQGMLVEDVKTKQPKVYRQWQEEPEKVCPPGGEMLGKAQDRVRGVLLRLIKKHKESVIGLVVPEPLATVVCHVLRHDQWGDLWKSTDGGRFDVLSIEPSGVGSGW